MLEKVCTDFLTLIPNDCGRLDFKRKKRKTVAAVFNSDDDELCYELARGTVRPEREAPNLGEWQWLQARAIAEPMLPAWILDMGAQHEKKIFSQYGEDGITEYILNGLPSCHCRDICQVWSTDGHRV